MHNNTVQYQIFFSYKIVHPSLNPESTNYTATYLPSRKLSKLDEPDIQDTAGEAGTCS